MPGSKHSVLGIIQVTIDKIIVSITGFTTIDHRGTIALDEKLLNPTISQVTGSRIPKIRKQSQWQSQLQ